MNKNLSTLPLATLALAGALCSATPTLAQVAGGTTTVEATVAASTRIAMGWSVKKTLMGKTVYNDAGQKVGNVDDLIISPVCRWCAVPNRRCRSNPIQRCGGHIGPRRHMATHPHERI